MECERARILILDRARGRLAPADAAPLDEHLAACAGCRRAVEVERLTDELLARRPVHRAPDGLDARLRARVTGRASGSGRTPLPSRSRSRSRSRPYFWLAAAALLLAVVAGVLRNRHEDRASLEARLSGEVVNDHLRILYSEHPLDVASGGIHQVKPWFAGKLDFAPLKIFEGDEDLPLQGGSVAVVLDRKAAAFVYKRRLHLVTLFVTRAEGLPWPAPNEQAGRLRVHAETVRGFSAITWREDELGYALVSDIDRAELVTIAAKVTAR